MKTTGLLLVGIAVLMLAVAGTSYASPTASANAGGTIASAIAIAKTSSTTDLEFGIIGPDADKTTWVTVAANVAATRTAGSDDSGVAHLYKGITPSAASFDVTGAGDATFSISLPPDTGAGVVKLTNGNAAQDMTVTSFVDDAVTQTAGKLSAGGTLTLLVGAKLNIAAGQAVGRYTGSFEVTVAYN